MKIKMKIKGSENEDMRIYDIHRKLEEIDDRLERLENKVFSMLF
jgi:hypothetical protein